MKEQEDTKLVMQSSPKISKKSIEIANRSHERRSSNIHSWLFEENEIHKEKIALLKQ